MAAVEYGANIVNANGSRENPFGRNWDTEDEAVEAAMDRLREGEKEVVVFRLEIVGDTIESDVTVRTLTQKDLH